MNASSVQKRRPVAGQFFVVRALDRKGHTRAGAVALARRRIERGGQGHSHALLVVEVAAVVRLKKAATITVEEVKNSRSKRRKRIVR